MEQRTTVVRPKPARPSGPGLASFVFADSLVSRFAIVRFPSVPRFEQPILRSHLTHARWGYPPGGLVVKSPMVAIDSKMSLAKFMQPLGLQLNSCQQMTCWRCGLETEKAPAVAGASLIFSSII